MLWLHSHQTLDTVSWWNGTRQYSCGSVDNFGGSDPGVGVVLAELEPHRIEDREGTSETDTEDPAEVPHRALPLSVMAAASLDIDEMHASPHEAHHDARVDQHDRQEYEHRDQHDEERERTARRVPDREARFRMRRGRQQEREQRYSGGRDDGSDAGTARDQRGDAAARPRQCGRQQRPQNAERG